MKSTNSIVEQTLTILVSKTSIGVLLNVNEKTLQKEPKSKGHSYAMTYNLKYGKIWFFSYKKNLYRICETPLPPPPLPFSFFVTKM